MAIQLKELEGLLYRLITAPGGVAEGLAAEPGLAARGGLGAVVLGDGRLSPEGRVDIYANMYFYRLLDVLKEDFSATLAVLGEVKFHNLVTGYLLEYPPTQPSVYHCGRYLAGFLRDHPLRAQTPYVADLAALERALVESFHAADAAPLDADAMRAIAPARWPAIRLATHPAAVLLSAKWRVAELARAVEEHRQWQPPAPGAMTTLVWRRDARVFYRELESIEVDALAAAARGATFARICELVAAAAGDADPVAELNRLLARWLADGILIVPPRPPRKRRAAR